MKRRGEKKRRGENKVLLYLAVHLKFRMCTSFHTSAWKFSELCNLNFVDHVSALNSEAMQMSPLGYNCNNALGLSTAEEGPLSLK